MKNIFASFILVLDWSLFYSIMFATFFEINCIMLVISGKFVLQCLKISTKSMQILAAYSAKLFTFFQTLLYKYHTRRFHFI